MNYLVYIIKHCHAIIKNNMNKLIRLLIIAGIIIGVILELDFRHHGGDASGEKVYGKSETIVIKHIIKSDSVQNK